MKHGIHPWERDILRELAARQAEHAALPIMRRERMWLETNTGRGGTRPPVVVEEWTFERDLMPESVCRCESKTARGIECQLLSAVHKADAEKIADRILKVHRPCLPHFFG